MTATATAPVAGTSAPPSAPRLGAIAGFIAATSALGVSAPPVILGRLAGDFRVPSHSTAWVLSSFTLALAVSTPLYGRLIDVRGIWTTLRAGAVLVIAGAGLTVAAPTFALLLAARVVEASGAAALSMCAFAILTARLEGAARAVALGVLTAESSLTLGAGPLLGALVDVSLGRRAVLALPALAALSVPAVAKRIPQETRRAGEVDVRGALLVLTAAGAVTALLQARATRLAGVWAAALALVGACGSIAAAHHTRKRPLGFLPQAVITNTSFAWLSLSAAALFAGYLGMLFVAPLLIGAGHRWGTVHVGTVMAPAALLSVAATRVASRLSARHAAHVLLAGVAVCSGLGVLLAAVASTHVVAVVVGLSATICGFAVAQVAVVDRIPALLPEPVRSVGIGVFNFAFITGGAVGAAAAGGLSDALPLRTATALLALAPLGALAATVPAGRVHRRAAARTRPVCTES